MAVCGYFDEFLLVQNVRVYDRALARRNLVLATTVSGTGTASARWSQGYLR